MMKKSVITVSPQLSPDSQEYSASDNSLLQFPSPADTPRVVNFDIVVIPGEDCYANVAGKVTDLVRV